MSLWAMVLRVLMETHEIDERLKEIEAEQVEQRALLQAILKAVSSPEAVSLVLKLGVPKQQK